MLASLMRLEWTMPSSRELIDDFGTSWDCGKDPPIAIVGAAKASVRRCRLHKIGAIFSGLIPAVCDIGNPANTDNT